MEQLRTLDIVQPDTPEPIYITIVKYSSYTNAQKKASLKYRAKNIEAMNQKQQIRNKLNKVNYNPQKQKEYNTKYKLKQQAILKQNISDK